MLRIPELHTERLVVREFALDDLDAVHELLDTQLGEAQNLAERRRWLEWTVLAYAQSEAVKLPPYGDRAITLRATGELVGACGLVPCLAPFHQVPGMPGASGYSAEVGLYWAVSPTHQRRGYATEAARALIGHAFSELHLARLVATTRYANTASIGVMRKLGMRVERNSRADPEWLQVVSTLSAPER
jgi:[ribosomal protein S5]-alanine N-acetyltransferase